MEVDVDRHRAQPLQTACVYWLHLRIQSAKKERVGFLATPTTSDMEPSKENLYRIF